MNKAVPWNVSGVGVEAREAARDAARRQGKSLGEWLHAAIAERAADRNLSEDELGKQDKVEAIRARLERVASDASRRPVAETRTGRRLRAVDEDDEDVVTWRREFRSDEPERDEPRHRRRPSKIDETESLLEEAIEAIERRAARSERETDKALASFARLLDTAEARRENEREAVTTLTQKIGDLETKLIERLTVSDDNPIKGALARLEARLDAIGRRSAAEAAAKANVQSAQKDDTASRSIALLDDKLNTILAAMTARPQGPDQAAAQVSHLAIAASQQAEGPAPRRLGDAIAEIAERQRALETPSLARHRSRPRLPVKPETITEEVAPTTDDTRAPFAAMQREIAAMAAKIEDMRCEAAIRRDRSAEPAPELDALRREIADMSQAIRDMVPRGKIAALDDSIRALANRIEASRDQGVRETVLAPVEEAVGDLRRTLADLDPRKTFGPLQQEVRSIADKIDDFAATGASGAALSQMQTQMADIRELVSITAARTPGLEQIETKIAQLTARIDQHRAEPSGAHMPGSEALSSIDSKLETLTARVDEAFVQAGRSMGAAKPDVSCLEGLVRDLGNRIEAAQAPQAEDDAVEALRAQIEIMASHFEQSEMGLAVLPKLQSEMRDLFAHLEATRASVETTAARAAREVLRIAIDEGKGKAEPAPAHEVAVLKAMQDEADERTQSTLSAVHATLEKVVDRLSAMETDLADMRARPVASAGVTPLATLPIMQAAVNESRVANAPGAKPRTSQTVSGDELMLGGLDPLLSPIFRQKPGRADKPAAHSAPRPQAGPRDGEAPRTDFIAAARRAAQAAQADVQAAIAKKAEMPAAKDARAGLLARSRDYVATHKRPVLLGLAAICVVLGTMAILQRLPLEKGALTAKLEPAARVVQTADGRRAASNAEPASRIAILPRASAASPDKAPMDPDPMQTASIPSLPSFAAGRIGAAAPEPQQSSFPSALKNAADSGNGPAAYELAARYVEGRGVPRDPKAAAKYFSLAADHKLAPAQYRLASLYEKGVGVAQDKAKAKALYLEAADSGNPRAMHNLAVLLADGDGRPDYTGAAVWFRRAAQYGVHDSQYNLAILLARGLGTPQSLVQSYQWFAVAAAQDDADAAKKRDEVGTKLSADELGVAKALAAAFKPKVADSAATEVQPPPGGWDGAGSASHLNSAASKISSL